MKDRRSFLRNTALSSLGLGLISKLKTGSIVNSSEDAVECVETTQDYYGEGPFYTDNPPLMVNNQLANADEPGQKIIISGRVLNLDCSEYIPDTIIDVWHADDAGQYDNESFNLRGYTKTNTEGFYLFESILPGKYLNGNTFRPSHIHFKITPPGFPELTTQLYFQGDDSIPGDAAASIDSGMYDATARIIPFDNNNDAILEGTFDIAINGEGLTVATKDLHIDKGMVYSLNPNPFTEELEIFYGLFRKAKVGLKVFDMEGRQVAILDESIKTPEKYRAYWKPDTNLPAGHYFVSLVVNDLQVHYLKVQKV